MSRSLGVKRRKSAALRLAPSPFHDCWRRQAFSIGEATLRASSSRTASSRRLNSQGVLAATASVPTTASRVASGTMRTPRVLFRRAISRTTGRCSPQTSGLRKLRSVVVTVPLRLWPTGSRFSAIRPPVPKTLFSSSSSRPSVSMATDASRAPQRRAAPRTTPARSLAGSAGPSAREAASLTRAKSALESSGIVTPGWSSAWSPSHAPVTLVAPSAGEAIPQAAGTEEGQRSRYATARGVAQRAPRDRAACARPRSQRLAKVPTHRQPVVVAADRVSERAHDHLQQRPDIEQRREKKEPEA